MLIVGIRSHRFKAVIDGYQQTEKIIWRRSTACGCKPRIINDSCLGGSLIGTSNYIGESFTDKNCWQGACCYRLGGTYLELVDTAKLMAQRRVLYNWPFQMVSSSDVRRMDYIYITSHGSIF